MSWGSWRGSGAGRFGGVEGWWRVVLRRACLWALGTCHMQSVSGGVGHRFPGSSASSRLVQGFVSGLWSLVSGRRNSLGRRLRGAGFPHTPAVSSLFLDCPGGLVVVSSSCRAASSFLAVALSPCRLVASFLAVVVVAVSLFLLVVVVVVVSSFLVAAVVVVVASPSSSPRRRLVIVVVGGVVGCGRVSWIFGRSRDRHWAVVWGGWVGGQCTWSRRWTSLVSECFG